jgi:hypothetical protein
MPLSKQQLAIKDALLRERVDALPQGADTPRAFKIVSEQIGMSYHWCWQRWHYVVGQ